jgi:hypothetical protein
MGMKRVLTLLAVLLLVFAVQATAGEKLAFIGAYEQVSNVFLYNPDNDQIQNITAYPLNGVAGYDLTPDGKLLVTAVRNPVTDKHLGLKLTTWPYPYHYEQVVMTYYAESWEAVRNQYKVAVDPTGKYVVCVDTLGALLVDLEEELIKYIFTHKQDNSTGGVCDVWQNWGGEFSSDGSSICMLSYCIANRMRYDIYNLSTLEYRHVYEVPNVTGFSWMPGSDGLLLSANSCGEAAGLYVADLDHETPLINLAVCNLGSAKCNRYFRQFYSEFYLPQVLSENSFMVYARGVKVDGTVLSDVFIIDQEENVVTQALTGDFIELKLSPSGKYLAGIVNPNLTEKQGEIFVYNFETGIRSYIKEEDNTCSQVQWIETE